MLEIFVFSTTQTNNTQFLILRHRNPGDIVTNYLKMQASFTHIPVKNVALDSGDIFQIVYIQHAWAPKCVQMTSDH